MSQGPINPLSDRLPVVNQNNLYHVVRHPVFGTYLGDGVWSKDRRAGVKDKVMQIEKCPAFLGNYDLSKLEINLFGDNEVVKNHFLTELEMHVIFPDLSDNYASPTCVQSAMIPIWKEEC